MEINFMSRMKIISEKLGLQLELNQEALDLHREFLKRRANNDTWDRVFTVIEAIKNNINIICEELDLVEQGYLCAWIEKTYDHIQAPLTRSFFSDTKEINDYITYYPNHYKAMNPNLEKFNGVPNPFYIWANAKK